MLIITYQEIQGLINDLYTDDGETIVTKHNPFSGEKEFALCMVANILALLNRNIVNDKFVIQYCQGLLSLTDDNSQHYETYLNAFAPNNAVKVSALAGITLSRQERQLLHEIFLSSLCEYTMKSDYQYCCYSAMKAFTITAYCVLNINVPYCVGMVDIIADLGDEVQGINISEAETENDIIIVDWHSTNKINSYYMLYKSKYPGLDEASVLDLVAADVIEEDYYFKDERFPIAPSILVKQYCAIIEHEVNEIIQLSNFANKPSHHLMWNRMKNYVRDNNICLNGAAFELNDLLDDLHELRNKAAHGDIISNEEYELVLNYKCDGLFDCLSIKKLYLKNIVITPTIEEIKAYMGI